MSCADSVQISADYLNEIKSALGAPLIDELDWGANTNDFIKSNIVTRVLRTYFSYFPIKYDTQTSINGTFSIDYPDDNFIFRMFRHFFSYKVDALSNFDNPFFLQTQVLYRGGGPYIEPYSMSEIFNRLSTIESVIDYSKAVRVEDYPDQRVVKGSTSLSGYLSIQWAKWSKDFSKITFSYIDDAIKLAKAYLLKEAARLRDQFQINTSKVSVNGDALREDARIWEEEVISNWKGRGFPVMVK